MPSYKFNNFSVSGIWNTIGCPVDGEDGVSIYLEDADQSENSLIELCGFSREVKKIGIIPEQKEISELIVLLPMVKDSTDLPISPIATKDSVVEIILCPSCSQKLCTHETSVQAQDGNVYQRESNYLGPSWRADIVYTSVLEPLYYSRPYSSPVPFGAEFDFYREAAEYGIVDSNFTASPKKSDTKKYLNLVENPAEVGDDGVKNWLFAISPDIINNILNTVDYKKYNIEQIKEILENKTSLDSKNTVVKLMRMMVKYNFPPHLNWLLNTNLPAYAMYVEEFTHILSKEDLSNIWQGTMPNIAQNPIEDSDHTIEHFLTDDEIFGGYDINNYDIKLRIFKVKKRAKNDYKKDVVNRYTVVDRAKEAETNIKWYKYNWPYDNFSLVELLKVEAGEVRDYAYETSGSLVSTTYNSDGTTSTTYTTTGEPSQEQKKANANAAQYFSSQPIDKDFKGFESKTNETMSYLPVDPKFNDY